MFELSVEESELKDIRKEARYYGLEVSWYPSIGHSQLYPPMDVRWLVHTAQTNRTYDIIEYPSVRLHATYVLRITPYALRITHFIHG